MSKLISSLALAAFAATGCILSLNAPASAVEVYSLPPGTLPDQSWSGSLGLDFQVTSSIVVYGLGAFYDGGAPITVAIYETNQPNTPLVETVITTGSPVYTFSPVAPITLTPGFYQVTAWGYGSGTGNYNTGTCPDPTNCPSLTSNSLTGFVPGLPWYNDPGVTGFADDHLDINNPPPGPQGPYHYYGAGNFEAFALATPLPATWTMLIAGFIGLGFVVYRGSKKSAAAIEVA
jgi:hypothetical protein